MTATESAVVPELPFNETLRLRNGSASAKVALSLRDRRRDQQEAAICRVSLNQRQTPLGRSRFLSQSDRATTKKRRHPRFTKLFAAACAARESWLDCAGLHCEVRLFRKPDFTAMPAFTTRPRDMKSG